MIVSWIFNSLDKRLQGSVAYTKKAKVIWDELKKRFTQGNGPHIHGLSVVKYYTKLNVLWNKLNDYDDVPKCICATATKYAKKNKVEKIHQLLMDLNAKTYVNVCLKFSTSSHFCPSVSFIL